MCGDNVRNWFYLAVVCAIIMYERYIERTVVRVRVLFP
jgi:hypothetical protein